MFDQFFDFVDEALGFERLRDDGVATCFVGAIRIERLEGSGEKDDRDVAVLRMRFDVLADLIAVLLRHDDVGEDDVGSHLSELLQGFGPVVDRCDLVIPVGKRQLDDLLDGDTVVSEKYLFRHGSALRYSSQRTTLVATGQEITITDRFLIFGHRGSPRRFPENTLASFDEAIRQGADGFETDLRLLSDRTAVLYHDDELADDDIESLSSGNLTERGAVVERLHDLAAYSDRTTKVLEIKRAKWEDVLLEHVKGWKNIVLTSFDHSGIAELARRKVSVPLGITFFGYVVDVADYAARLGATWCFPGYHYVDEEMVEALHRRNIRVVPWTPNRPREWKRLREIGCDGVITDLPGEAVEWRNAES